MNNSITGSCLPSAVAEEEVEASKIRIPYAEDTERRGARIGRSAVGMQGAVAVTGKIAKRSVAYRQAIAE